MLAYSCTYKSLLEVSLPAVRLLGSIFIYATGPGSEKTVFSTSVQTDKYLIHTEVAVKYLNVFFFFLNLNFSQSN